MTNYLFIYMIIYCKPSTLLVLYVIREIYHLYHIICNHLYFGTLGPIGIPNCTFSKVTVISVDCCSSDHNGSRELFVKLPMFRKKDDLYMRKTEPKLSLSNILEILSSILFPTRCRPSETRFLWSPLRKQS